MNRTCELCSKPCSKRRKLCTYCNVKLYRYRLKAKAVEYKGGKCEQCGESVHLAAFDFHHLDPSTKEFGICVSNNKSWQAVKKELEKCILLCRNCHAELHSDYDRVAKYLKGRGAAR